MCVCVLAWTMTCLCGFEECSARLCPGTAPERVSGLGCECSRCARSPAPLGLTQLLPFRYSHFWEVFWAPCRKDVSRTQCRNGVFSHRKNHQKQEAGRCHSDTKNVFMSPKQKGARKQSACLSTHTQPSALSLPSGRKGYSLPAG